MFKYWIIITEFSGSYLYDNKTINETIKTVCDHPTAYSIQVSYIDWQKTFDNKNDALKFINKIKNTLAFI